LPKKTNCIVEVSGIRPSILVSGWIPDLKKGWIIRPHIRPARYLVHPYTQYITIKLQRLRAAKSLITQSQRHHRFRAKGFEKIHKQYTVVQLGKKRAKPGPFRFFSQYTQHLAL
jgi:hypothetical protein